MTIWCARMIEVTAAIPSAASAQPCSTHWRCASATGSCSSRDTAECYRAIDGRPLTLYGRPSTFGRMTTLHEDPQTTLHRPLHPVRFVTAASLFDGHDAAINIMRRVLQAQGAEVI